MKLKAITCEGCLCDIVLLSIPEHDDLGSAASLERDILCWGCSVREAHEKGTLRCVVNPLPAPAPTTA